LIILDYHLCTIEGLADVLTSLYDCKYSKNFFTDEDVDKCIRNLTAIGRDGMNETDELILKIMTDKC